MTTPTYAVHVRLESALDRDELVRRMQERAPQFRAIEGLIQKYYIADTSEPGVYGGFYLWRSLDDVAAYRASELAATIADAYECVGTPTVTVHEVLMPLRQ